MAKTRIKYIEGANKTYPMWNKIDGDLMEIFKDYHKELRKNGYNIRCANVAEKDGELYWILMDNGNYTLEHYGTLNPGKKGRRNRHE